MGYDPYKDPLYIPCSTLSLTLPEAAVALRNGWKIFFGQYPEKKQLALLFAQSALETGRWKIMRNYNFGNIKKATGEKFTMFRCNEIIKGKLLWFDPPHIQTMFRAYDSADIGAKEYIKFLATRDRYIKAWHEVIVGDPVKYSYALADAGYYTANKELYTRGIIRLAEEFKKNYDLLMAGQPVELKETFLPEEKALIYSLIDKTTKMSLDEYFAYANNMPSEAA
jgi:hypothetical protein